MISTLSWRPGHALAERLRDRYLPLLHADQAQTFGDLVVWDSWPLLDRDGQIAAPYWFALAAPRRGDPELRHGEARIHLLERTSRGFEIVGSTLPPELSPGSREWSGSATLSGDEVVLRFTAAGQRGEQVPGAQQRLFACTGRMTADGPGGWSDLREIAVADEHFYARVASLPALPGMIQGFRDPEPFRDLEGREWLLFTGSSPAAGHDHDGLVGLALMEGEQARLHPPLVDAVGVNRELERPHIRLLGGLLYLFWSTQSSAFSSEATGWPTGLYGAVAERIEGPWRLLNGDGLVAANPPEQPSQAYSWLVLPDASVTSFADRLPVAGQLHFVGGFAPFLQLEVEGDRARVVP